ncbi:hypothetical protein [Shimia sp. Alg240-R146]|uniref:hypothetical protein n=1 Tax=Shimia sp. Alg240-R146 TaxID=2993449 RepID=UPI0022E75F59|nr:hypothetical protein [Shimia sp. Alg240-R146]
MSTFLPPDVQAGLDAARKKALKQRHRLRVEANGRSFRVIKFEDDGFTLDIQDAPHLRGLVDVFDGGNHLYQCLIVASSEEADEMRYDFKRHTLATDQAPVDFERVSQAPVALLGKEG